MIATNLTTILRTWVVATGAGRVLVGPFDVVFPNIPSEQHYLEPDLLFISKGRLAIITRNNVQGPPDLVVEILSSSTARRDWRDKWRAYEQGGVAHYWVIDPDNKILTAFKLADGAYQPAGRFTEADLFSPADFPGLRISLSEVWV